MTSIPAVMTGESSRYYHRNPPVFCYDVLDDVVPTFNTGVESDKTQRCPRFHCDRRKHAEGGHILKGTSVVNARASISRTHLSESKLGYRTHHNDKAKSHSCIYIAVIRWLPSVSCEEHIHPIWLLPGKQRAFQQQPSFWTVHRCRNDCL